MRDISAAANVTVISDDGIIPYRLEAKVGASPCLSLEEDLLS